jgi:prepilin-type processing-associated H-X9-DG protein
VNGWWVGGYFREVSWRMNYNITPLVGWDSVIGMAIPEFGRKVTVPAPSEKVLLIESHYEAISGDRWGTVNCATHWPWGAGSLSEFPSNRNSRWSPPRHKGGLVVAFFDGSGRVVPFSQRVKLCEDWPNNSAAHGSGPNWALDRK